MLFNLEKSITKTILMFVLFNSGYQIQTNSRKDKMVRGLKVKTLSASSPFFLSGIKKNDIILSINNNSISDELDFHFFSADSSFEVEVIRNNERKKLLIYRDEGSFSEIEFFENPINCCKNKCIFCFIDQMPRGLRRGLYIKDEDLKHSFLNGNYVTLSGATLGDLEKIVQIGLSPLYISVHVTDHKVRKKILGNNRAPDIMEQLQFLKKNWITFHTQIVVCPGINDGDVLDKTINDLFSLSSSLMSIAVVPVGLTNFRKIPLQPVTKSIAENICKELNKTSDAHFVNDGYRRLFIADEFFVKAALPVPPKQYYEDYPQIENGVGLLRQLLEEWKQFKKTFKNLEVKSGTKRKKHLLITSQSAFFYLNKILQEAHKCQPSYAVEFHAVPVVNKYFGETVTVAGLLTAKDIIRVIKKELSINDYDMVIVPRVMFNYAGSTLDGYSEERISNTIGVPLKVAETVENLLIDKRKKHAGKR